MPDDGPLAGGLLYKDGGALAGRPFGDRDGLYVHPFSLELTDGEPAEFVLADLPHVGAPHSPPGKGDEGSGHLPSAGELEAAHP